MGSQEYGLLMIFKDLLKYILRYNKEFKRFLIQVLMIIGICGRKRAGKTEVAKILEEDYGFLRLSFRQVVLEEALKRDLGSDTGILQTLGYSERIEKGVYVWVDRLISMIKPRKNYVVEGIRYVEDATRLQEKLNKKFHLVGIYASDGLRERRTIEESLRKGRPGDPRTHEEFVAMDEKDRGIVGERQKTDEVYRMAKHTIYNDKNDIIFLRRRVLELLQELKFVIPK